MNPNNIEAEKSKLENKFFKNVMARGATDIKCETKPQRKKNENKEAGVTGEEC